MNQFAAIAQIHFAIVVIAIIIGFACYIPSVRAICNFVVLNCVILTLCFLSCNSHFTRSLYIYIYVVVDIQLSQTILSNDGLAYFVSSIRCLDYLYFSCIFIAPIWEVCSIFTSFTEVRRSWPACTLTLYEECSDSITPSRRSDTFNKLHSIWICILNRHDICLKPIPLRIIMEDLTSRLISKKWRTNRDDWITSLYFQFSQRWQCGNSKISHQGLEHIVLVAPAIRISIWSFSRIEALGAHHHSDIIIHRTVDDSHLDTLVRSKHLCYIHLVPLTSSLRDIDMTTPVH